MDVVKERKEKLVSLIDEKFQEFQKFHNQQIHQSNNEPFLKDRLQQVRQRLNAIPRIGKQQFSNLPPQQREQYIQMIEKLTAECSVILSRLQELEKKNTEVQNQTLDLPKKVEVEIQTSAMVQQNDSSQQISHFIVEALETVRQREEKRKKEKLESLRTSIIQGQRGHLRISPNRLLFRLKVRLLQEDSSTVDTHTKRFEEFLQKEASLWTRNLLKSIYEQLELKCKFLVTWNDLKELFHYHEYIIEECLLFAFAQHEYQHLQRSQLVDPKAQEKRQLRLELIDSNNKWNQDLQAKWSQLDSLEKLRYFVQEDKISNFDAIIEKARNVGLKEESIVQILLSDKQGKLYGDNFRGDVQTPPKKVVPEDILNGIHTISDQVAKIFNITEKILLKEFGESEIKKLYESKDKKLLYSKLDFGKVEEFKEYWNELTFFDEKDDSATKDTVKETKPLEETKEVNPSAQVSTPGVKPKKSLLQRKSKELPANKHPIIEEAKEDVRTTSSKM